MLVCVALAVNFVSLRAAAPPNRWLITGNEAGQFHIGMTVENARDLIGVDRAEIIDLNLEGLFSPGMVVPDSEGKRSLVGEIECSHANRWVFWRIRVYDRRYRTSRGIGVGSSYTQVTKEYPEVKLSDEEGRALLDNQEGISYVISDGPLPTATVTSLILSGREKHRP